MCMRYYVILRLILMPVVRTAQGETSSQFDYRFERQKKVEAKKWQATTMTTQRKKKPRRLNWKKSSEKVFRPFLE